MRRLPSKPQYILQQEIEERKRKIIKREIISFFITIAVVLIALAVYLFFQSDFWQNYKDLQNDEKDRTNGIDCVIQNIDYEYGSGIYFECGEENALIDYGTGKHIDELLKFIENQGIQKIDYLCVPSISAEYSETLETIMNSVETWRIIIPKCDDSLFSMYDDLTFRHGKTLLSADSIPYFFVDKMVFNVIDYETISLKIEFGNHSFLIFNFDDENKEYESVGSIVNPDSDVLISLNGKIPADSIFETVLPEVVVMHGKEISNDDLMSAKSFSDDVYITGLNGNIVLYSNEVDLKIECENQ